MAMIDGLRLGPRVGLTTLPEAPVRRRSSRHACRHVNPLGDSGRHGPADAGALKRIRRPRAFAVFAVFAWVCFTLPALAEEQRALGAPSVPSDSVGAVQGAPTARKWPCKDLASQELFHLEDGGGQVALQLELRSFSCWPLFEDARIDVRSRTGRQLRFSSRTVQKSPGRLSVELSRYEVEFEDGSVLALKVGEPVLVPPGLTPEHPGSRFVYRGRELVFTIDRPVKPVWTSKEGVAFRELLPEDAHEVMEELADGRKALAEGGGFGALFELFVAMYLGQEAGSSGRDGYHLTLVKREAQGGTEAKPVEPFRRAATPRDDGKEGLPEDPEADMSEEAPANGPDGASAGVAPSGRDDGDGSRTGQPRPIGPDAPRSP